MLKHSSLLLILLSIILIGFISTLFLLTKDIAFETRTKAEVAAVQFYGVKFAQGGDFAQLVSLGVKHPVVVLRPGQSESEWESMLSQAEAAGVKPVVWLYVTEPHGCWNWTGSDWTFCSDGNRYLDFFDNEAKKGENSRFLAVYGIHEGYNFGNSTAEQQKLYSKIKERAPSVKIYSKIYSDRSQNRDVARREISQGGFAPGICDYCGILYHPFRIGDTSWETSPGKCEGTSGSCKDKFLSDFAIDKNLIQNQGQSIFVANVQTLDWPSSGVYRMATTSEMKEIGCYILSQGADGINWYSWGDNSGWQGLNHFSDRWPIISQVINQCGSSSQPSPTAADTISPQPTPTLGEGVPTPTLTSPTVTSIPASSPTPTPACGPLGDIDCSCEVNSLDYNYLVAKYYTDDQKADLDNSGQVNSLDVSILLSNFGKKCPSEPSPTPGQASPQPTPTGTLGTSPTLGPSPTPGPISPPGTRKVKYYGVEAVAPSDFDTLSGLGVDTVVAIFSSGNQSQWQSFLDAAKRNNIKMIVWPLGPGVCDGLFPWSKSGDSWDISAAHSMLDFMAQNSEQFVAITIAHEPGWSCPMSNTDMETIRKLIKDYVQQKHGKEIKVTNKINGVSDSGNRGITGNVTDIAEIWMHCTTGGSGGRGAEGDCQTALDGSDPRSAKQARAVIDRNNWNMELIFDFESFGMAGSYKMPTAAEMKDWGCKFVQSGYLDGFIWYTWQNEASYSEYLAKDRYDAAGEDRWEAVKYVKENCLK